MALLLYSFIMRIWGFSVSDLMTEQFHYIDWSLVLIDFHWLTVQITESDIRSVNLHWLQMNKWAFVGIVTRSRVLKGVLKEHQFKRTASLESIWPNKNNTMHRSTCASVGAHTVLKTICVLLPKNTIVSFPTPSFSFKVVFEYSCFFLGTHTTPAISHPFHEQSKWKAVPSPP